MEFYSVNKEDRKFNIIPLILVIAFQIAEVLFSLLVAGIVPKDSEFRFSSTWFFGKLLTLIIVVIICFKSIVSNSKDVFKNFKRFVPFVLVAFVVFYLCSIGTNYYLTLIEKVFGVGDATNQAEIEKYFQTSDKTIHYVMLFLTIVICAPLLEELEFRKLIFDAFPNTHFIVPVLTSGLLFGLAHMAEFAWTELLYLPVYMIPGFVLALIYHYSNKNVFATFTVHMLSNLISFIVLIVGL